MAAGKQQRPQHLQVLRDLDPGPMPETADVAHDASSCTVYQAPI